MFQRDEVDGDDFLQMISSRWNPDTDRAREVGVDCLRTVSITIWGGVKASGRLSLDCLECFRDVGLRLHVS